MTDRSSRVTALVIGITGQDGVYLAELLTSKGYNVIGVTRDAAKAAVKLPPALLSLITLEEWDLEDQARVVALFKKYRPAEAYNCAARSSGEGMFDDPAGIGTTNGIAVTYMLEAARAADAGTRFCQASSSEMFGDALTSPQSETTPFNPRSPYGAAKLYAHSMVDVYRRSYGVYACSAILFNNESPRRPLHYVTRKVSRAAASIKLGLADELRIGSMTARRDWGFAGDYVQAMWTMLQQPGAGDYVVATGIAHSVRDLCDIAFSHVGLNYLEYVKSDTSSSRPNERTELLGDARKALTTLGWKPKITFDELIRMMVDADLVNLRQGGIAP